MAASSSKLLVNQITNASIKINGQILHGRAEEIDFPKITYKMVEHRGLGMVGTPRVFAGIEAMETRIKWAAFYEEVYKHLVNPTKVVKVEAFASLESWTGLDGRVSELPLSAVLLGTFMTVPGGNYRWQDKAEFENEMNLNSFKIVVDKTEYLYIDVFNNILIANGIDVLAKFTQNIGG
jgi:P2 family phage contractile tail tube protein